MARQRIQTQYNKSQARLNPQARPVDTYVQPSRNNQLSSAIDSVTGNMQRKAVNDQNIQNSNDAAAFKIQQLQVAEAAHANGDLSSWKDVKGGLSLADNPKYGPLLQIEYNQKIGTENGLDVQSSLFKWDSENAHLRLQDPVAYNEALDSKTLELLQERLGPETVDAVGYASNMRNQVSAAVNQLKSQQFSEYRTAQAALPLDNYLVQLSAGINSAEIASKDTPDLWVSNLTAAVQTQLDAKIQTKTLAPAAANAATVDFLITYAEKHENLEILEVAENIRTGHGGFLGGIHSENKKLIQARRSLASHLEGKAYKAYQQETRLDQAASSDYQEAAFQYFRIHGNFDNFEGPETSQGRMGLYDIDKVQKRIQEFNENPVLSQEDYLKYYDQFSMVEELDQDRAYEMLEKMDINSQAEWRLAESAMSDAINKRTSVYKSVSYTDAAAFIDNSYKIDPQTKLPLGDISAENLNEYHKAVAQYKRKVTSFTLDQAELDKALRSIDAPEELQGQSLHMLSAHVKYELFKDTAKEAYNANSTTLEDKLVNSQSNLPESGTTYNANGVTVTVTQTGVN